MSAHAQRIWRFVIPVWMNFLRKRKERFTLFKTDLDPRRNLMDFVPMESLKGKENYFGYSQPTLN